MLKYKINIIEELKKRGINSTNVKKTRLFGQVTMGKFRKGDTNINATILNRLCCLLELQPGDIISYENTEDDKTLLYGINQEGKLYED